MLPHEFSLLEPFQTKTEAEVASEKEWLEAEKVWVVHKGGFSGGRMLKSSPASPESDTTRKVKLDHGGEIMNIDEECVEKVGPRHQGMTFHVT